MLLVCQPHIEEGAWVLITPFTSTHAAARHSVWVLYCVLKLRAVALGVRSSTCPHLSSKVHSGDVEPQWRKVLECPCFYQH